MSTQRFFPKIGYLLLLLLLSFSASACSGSSDLVYVTPAYLLEAEEEAVVGEVTSSPADEDDEGEPIPLPTELADLINSGEGSSVIEYANVENLPSPRDYEWVAIARGFDAPIYLTHAGDGSNRVFVVEQAGRIWEVNEDLSVDEEPFLDMQERISISFEQGLLGLAFPKNFSSTNEFYINYTDPFGNTQISRFITDDLHEVAILESESSLFNIFQPAVNNNGGQLAFGPDGYLYIGLSDGGGVGDPNNNAQSLDSLLGKILRIDINFNEPYSAPLDNPYFGLSRNPEIWAIGLRNPRQFSFDRLTGDLYITDQGHLNWEEINFLPSGSLGGSNFGWNYFEGAHIYGAQAPNISFTAPVAEYNHGDIGNGCDIIGGYAYRGSAMPEWDGVYFFADRCLGVVFGLIRTDDSWRTQVLYDFNFEISSFGQDENGEIYLIDYDNGDIYRLEKR